MRSRADAMPARRAQPAPGASVDAAHRVALAVVLALIALLALRQVGSLDAGFHLKAGESILDGAGWPAMDAFTYTINDHPYIDTSWGYQVVAALAQRGLGASGLILLNLALILSTFALLIRTARLAPADPTALVLALLAGGVAAEMRYEVRPELASWLLLASTLYLLHRREERPGSALWALPVIHLVWANTHALFVLGWAAIGCFALGSRARRGTPDRALLGWGAASVGIVLINPYGWRGAVFPFTLATRMQERNVFSQTIGEFVSPFALGLSDQFPFYPRAPILCFRVFAVLAVVAAIGLIAKRRYSAALLTVPFMILAARMIRNIPLVVIACLPGLAWGLPVEAILRRKRAAVRAVLAAATAAAIILGLRVATDGYYIASRRPDRFGTGWNGLILPIDAVGWARSAGLDGPVLNHLNFGGYMMWARPRRVFIDGRLEVTGESFYRSYTEALSSQNALEAMVAKHGIQWIIFPYATNPKLLGRLGADPRWRPVYADHLATIFVRSDLPPLVAAPSLPGPPAPAPVDTLPGLGGLPRTTPVAAWFQGLTQRQRFPSRAFNLGLFSYYLGDMPGAAAWFGSAARESGGAYYEVYNNLGAALYREGRREDAAACYRIVVEDDPGNRQARERSGVSRPAR